MKLTLSRNDQITLHRIKANFKRAQKRPDIEWVCEWMKDNKDRFDIDLLSKELGVGKAYIRVLKNNLKKLGVLSENYLTDDGYDAAKNGSVYIKEEGVYKMWLINDRFYLKHDGFDYILHWKPKEYTYNEKNPKRIDKKINQTITSAIDENIKAKDWIIEVRGNPHGKSTVEVEWILTIPNDELSEKDKIVQQEIILKGKIKGYDGDKEIEFKKLTDSSYELNSYELIKTLKPYFKKNFNGWDFSKSGLKVEFDNITKTERESFAKDCDDFEASYKKIKFIFSLKDVPIVPTNKRDASKWLEWLVEREITEHKGTGEIIEIVEKIKRETPLGEFDINFDLNKVLTRYWKKKDKKFWYMSASKDFGDKYSIKPVIKSGDKLSYSQALERLFPDVNFAQQEKLIYMDRHALQGHNIKNMEWLIDSINKKGFKGDFILITHDNGTKNTLDIKVKYYNELYPNKWPPHGRYFVAKSNIGKSMFELTHNLVHPRIDEGDDILWGDISSIEREINRIKDDPVRSKLIDLIDKR